MLRILILSLRKYYIMRNFLEFWKKFHLYSSCLPPWTCTWLCSRQRTVPHATGGRGAGAQPPACWLSRGWSGSAAAATPQPGTVPAASSTPGLRGTGLPSTGRMDLRLFISSVSAPDPDPPDPHDFGPPGSGSNSQRYGSSSGFGSFYHPSIKQK